jgi:F-type H+-transporting ATPase subunit b
MISIDLAVVIQFVNFLVLMVVLNFFLYKPVRKILADREKEIADAHERTVSVDREVREKMELYELKLRQTTAMAAEEKSKAIQKAREQEAAVIDKARKEAAGTVATIQKRVAGEAEEARHFLREQAQTISHEICEKVLGRSLQQ